MFRAAGAALALAAAEKERRRAFALDLALVFSLSGKHFATGEGVSDLGFLGAESLFTAAKAS